MVQGLVETMITVRRQVPDFLARIPVQMEEGWSPFQPRLDSDLLVSNRETLLSSDCSLSI